MSRVVVLSGATLTIEDVVAIGRNKCMVELDSQALVRCEASRKILDDAVDARQIIYGVNTSFGPMCNKIIHESEIETLQVNLIRSHAAGLGDPLSVEISRATLAIRLNTLVKGYSGVRISLLRAMRDMLNRDLIPLIPEQGSVGASGDLIHLAHLGLGIIGEGELFYKGVKLTAKEAFEKAGVTPFTLSYKEGIAIMNGTAAMSAIASFALESSQKVYSYSLRTAAFAMEIFGGIDDAFDPDLHGIKPHPGQVKVAEEIEQLIAGSQNITFRHTLHDNIRSQEQEGLVFETHSTVQDVYSIRCTPQVLAPVQEALEAAIKTVEIEINSSNDNPLIIPEKKKVVHGGNFHGQSISFAMDTLRIALATACNISERRLNKLLDRNLNDGLPENLIAGETGLDMGFMGTQYLATSTTAENRQLASPMSVQSISSNESNQDVVSMGTVSARLALKAVENAKHVLTLEILADLQALSFRHAEGLSPKMREFYNELTPLFSQYRNERVFHNDLVSMRKKLFSSL